MSGAAAWRVTLGPCVGQALILIHGKITGAGVTTAGA